MNICEKYGLNGKWQTVNRRRLQKANFTSPVCRFTHSMFITFFLLITGLSGCNESFQPLSENHTAPFSIFGYLDTSADTQWVRLTPVRKQLDLSTDVSERNVTIEHLQKGNTAAMHDSLILFPDGFHILNAWAVTDILKPEQTYRLKAERPDGAASTVTITFPEDFPTPVLEIYDIVNVSILTIQGVERLVSVQWQARAHVVSESAGWDYVRVFRRSMTDYVRQVEPGKYRLRSGISDGGFVYGMVPEPPRDDLEVEILDLQIFVASGGPEWKEEFSSLDDRNYSLPNVTSNVENGVGYLFGIVSKSIPFKSCFNDQGEFIACPAEKPL
jgi:hypothetical protein